MKTALVLVLLSLSTAASADGYRVYRSTIPGTDVPDYSRNGRAYQVEEGRGGTNVYQTLPGTSVRDYSAPAVRAERDGSIFQTIPGTNVRDYSRPGWSADD